MTDDVTRRRFKTAHWIIRHFQLTILSRETTASSIMP